MGVVLVVLGLRPDGKIIDYRLARAPPSASSTTSTPRPDRRRAGDDLRRRGLLAAPAYHGIPVQRCRAHKIRPRQGSQGRSGHRQAGSPRCRRQPYQGPERRQPFRHTLGRCISQGCRMPARRSRRSADLLPLPGPRSTQTGQHAIERREVRPLGVFQDRTSMDRILIFIHENKQQGIQYSLTHKS